MRTHIRTNLYTATAWQLFVPLMILWLSRLLFIYANSSIIGDLSTGRIWQLMFLGLRFDIVAVAYFNAPWILLRALPVLRAQLSPLYNRIIRWVYMILNSAMMIFQIGDTAYYPFTSTRLTFVHLFDVLKGQDALGGLMAGFMREYWWAFLAGIIAIALLALLSSLIRPRIPDSYRRNRYARWGFLVAMAVLTLLGIRYHLTGRSLSHVEARNLTHSDPEANAVLNTPFNLVRTLTANEEVPHFKFLTPEEMELWRNSRLQSPAMPDSMILKGRNLMVIVLEGGGSVHNDYLTPHPTVRMHHHHFMDSIARKSVVVKHHMATSVLTAQGLTSMLGGLPSFRLEFIHSRHGNNRVDGLQSMLKAQGYRTLFIFGGRYVAFNIGPLAYKFGAEQIYDGSNYPVHNDSTTTEWGVWDHLMAEAVPAELSKLREPFAAAWLTLNAHSPFHLPDHWKADRFTEPPLTMNRSQEYADLSVEHFFEEASKQPWFNRTVFVIVADHGDRDQNAAHNGLSSPYIMEHVPFIVYTPDGALKPRYIDDRVMSQFDLAPTLLALLGNDEPRVSFGVNVLAEKPDSTHYALSWPNEGLHIVATDLVVHFDPFSNSATGVFDPIADPTLSRPLPEAEIPAERLNDMLFYTRGFLQNWSERMHAGTTSVSVDAARP